MNSKITNIILLGIVLIVFVSGAIAYPALPEQIASHWNVRGEADGYSGKFWGIFLFPFIMAGIYLLYLVIPKIDPLKKNLESFRPAYNTFWIWTFGFFTYIFGLSLVWNFGYRFNFTTAIVPATSALFYIIGGVLEKSKRNWFVGIRTPWTLSSDIVWDKTHKLGGRLFKVVALASLAGMFARDSYVIATIIIPVILVSVITVVYSYFVYKKQNGQV